MDLQAERCLAMGSQRNIMRYKELICERIKENTKLFFAKAFYFLADVEKLYKRNKTFCKCKHHINTYLDNIISYIMYNYIADMYLI